MKLYKEDNTELTHIKKCGFINERRIQNIVEKNLDNLLGIEFLSNEYQLGKFRLDTVAYDNDNSSFVIIEYKNNVNTSIVDQGYAYLNTLLQKKDSLIRLYEHHYHKEVEFNHFDWEQTKIIFIATGYTEHQLYATNNPDMPIEMYKVEYFDNNFFTFEHIKKDPKPKYAKNVDSKKENVYGYINSVKDLNPINEDDLVSRGNDEVKALYHLLKETVLGWDSNIDLNITRVYIGFKINGKDFMDVNIQVKKLKISLNMKKGTLKDPLNLARDMSVTGMYGNGDYQIEIKNDEEIFNIYRLIKQSLKYNYR